jgi:hypothetical protein
MLARITFGRYGSVRGLEFRMARSSLDKKALSRSKIELFLECPRCFYEDVVLGVARPGGLPFTLNIAVDTLLKSEFDRYRETGTPHPLFASVGLDAVPHADPRLKQWRHNFTGIRFLDSETGWTFYGAIDDLWRGADGRMLVADYKATAKKDEVDPERLHPAYKRQLEMYQFLLSTQGLDVSDTGWWVYANGIGSSPSFEDVLRFRTRLIPYQGNRAWVLKTFRDAVATLSGPLPPPAEACEWCRFVAAREEAERSVPREY